MGRGNLRLHIDYKLGEREGRGGPQGGLRSRRVLGEDLQTSLLSFP